MMSSKNSKLLLFLLLVLGSSFAAFVNPLIAIASIISLIIIIFLVRNIDFGAILLVFFFPYIGLVIDFGMFEVFQDIAYLRDVNAPFIDLYGLLLFTAWLMHILLRHKGNLFRSISYFFTKLPYIKTYFFFWVSGIVAFLRVPSIYLVTSLKYFVRPFTFFYLIFFTAPLNIIRESSKRNYKFIERILVVFFVTGLIAGINGLLGLLFGSHMDFPRAVPFAFFGINPLGPNHNLLAETLIATAPAGLILVYILDYKYRLFVRYGMLFQWAIALLTFARTAWISIFIQLILYIYFAKRGKARKYIKEAIPAIIVIAAMVLVLFATTFTDTVRGSTLTRLDMARISLFYFERSPVIGNGVGTFIPTLWQTRAYLLEYGDPVDAHGIIFKLMFEQGLFGIVTFLALIGAILWSIIKKYTLSRHPAILASILIATGSITYQLFNTTYYTSKLWVPMAIAVVVADLYYKKAQE